MVPGVDVGVGEDVDAVVASAVVLWSLVVVPELVRKVMRRWHFVIVLVAVGAGKRSRTSSTAEVAASRRKAEKDPTRSRLSMISDAASASSSGTSPARARAPIAKRRPSQTSRASERFAVDPGRGRASSTAASAAGSDRESSERQPVRARAKPWRAPRFEEERPFRRRRTQ